MTTNWFIPSWPAPAQVRALITTRAGGVSEARYGTLNLGDHVGDEPARVSRNRAILRLALPAAPHWLRQVHGTRVIRAECCAEGPEADAAWAITPGTVCAVLSAGWRGLAAGVIESTVAALPVAAQRLLVYLGPAIGPQAYVVGDTVRDAYVTAHPADAQAFIAADPGRWHADLYALARQRLRRLGIDQIYGGDYCTFSDSERFFSHRRDGPTGRMASLVWLSHPGSTHACIPAGATRAASHRSIRTWGRTRKGDAGYG
jgi:copper oxidase (laccase) domain-containing protein